MEQLFEIFLKNGLRPLSIFSETAELERTVSRSELTALLMLRFNGELTMSNLAAELGAPLSTVTSLTKRLIRKGLIERRQSDSDQRIVHVKLTDEGQKLAMQGLAVMKMLFDRVSNALSSDELRQFLDLAVKVGKALQEKQTGKGEKQANERVRKIPIDGE